MYIHFGLDNILLVLQRVSFIIITDNINKELLLSLFQSPGVMCINYVENTLFIRITTLVTVITSQLV